LYLQIAIEQGLPSLIALVAMIIFSILGLMNVYRQGNSLIRIYCAATFAVLIAMLGHGMVDAEIYVHFLLPIIFLPFGLALALLLGETSKQPMLLSDAAIRRANRFAFFGSLAPFVAIVVLFLWPGALAAFQANMGAVAQTRVELATYHWPEWPIQDELRRNDAVDLSAATNYYASALAFNPTNVTAHRRLGQIALSLGEYSAAQRHLETAYDIAPDQRAARQMLGEIYAIRGDLEKAIQLWKTVDTTNGQLDARVWWHIHIGAEEQADWIKQAISQLNTTN
jgi:tetratricopeptide (TPR) repeat protein